MKNKLMPFYDRMMLRKRYIIETILYIQPVSDGMGREFTYLSSHATNRYFIPNWGYVYAFLYLLTAFYCYIKFYILVPADVYFCIVGDSG